MSAWLSDGALRHLRAVADLPDTTGTRYEVLEEVGRGGMAAVYRARDRELDREVALKVEGAAVPERERARMLREARILARLEHPGIVPVHDVGVLPDGRTYYAMKLVRGESLDARAAQTPLPELLRLFTRVCEAVAFAHAHGVVHRDLKPGNVMVGAFGEVLVMDWGVAKLRADAAAEERGTVLGTPGYMPPEQERGEVERIDERADVYALGALLRFLVERAGTAPGAGGRARRAAPLRPLRAICDRAAAAEPAARYPSVAALAADLAAYLDGGAVAAYREGALERVARLVRPYRTPLLLVAAYLLMRVVLLLALGR